VDQNNEAIQWLQKRANLDRNNAHIAVGAEQKKKQSADEQQEIQRKHKEAQDLIIKKNKLAQRKLIGYDMRTADYMRVNTLKIMNHFE
jgi:hypothetical protein